MPNILINGIIVEFPHDPYQVQVKFMEKMICSIQNSENSVLESPTGTGKTLSLLCSTLGCIQRQKEKTDFHRCQPDVSDSVNLNPEVPWMSKIIFSSRTHSQLKQAMKELKSTSYYKRMNTAILGSRKQMCINSEVQDQNKDNIHKMCKSKVKQQKCSFYNKFDQLKNDENFMDTEINYEILDIEDLVKLGTEKQFCPYYMSQHMAENADIVFSPYNYILDERIRCKNNTLMKIVTNSITIFDEAHNIPQICEDNASIEFDTDDISTALTDVEFVSELLRLHRLHVKLEFDESDVTHFKGCIQRFQSAIDEIVISSPLDGVEFDGKTIFTLMDKAEIAYHTARNISILIDKIIDFLAQVHRLSQCGAGLRKFGDILWVPFSDSGEEFQLNVKTHYRVYAELKKDDQSKVIVPYLKVYYFWCFSAKFVLEKLVKQMCTRSITFTSGTMSPLGPFIESLHIPINITLQNNHIVPRSQVLVEIISSGPDGKTLDSSYWNRSTPEYIRSLGSTILSLCPVIPDGLLIFFTSYKVLNSCKDSWQDSGIWSQIQKIKRIFIEPRLKQEFLETMEDYYANINDPRTKGAIFMGVCRGKVAEGLDFVDKNGRAVIITGIPFPPWNEKKVQIKMKYLNDLGAGLNGQEWYDLEAIRAVNQAVGRIIRHKNDFGAILLSDYRFHNTRQKNQLSVWIKNHVKGSNSFNCFGTLISSIVQFFKQNQTPSITFASNCANGPLPLTYEMEKEAMERFVGRPMSDIEFNLLFENIGE